MNKRLLNGLPEMNYGSEIYRSLDAVFSVVTVISVVVWILFLVVGIQALSEIFKKKRIRDTDKKSAVIFLDISLLLFLGYGIYRLPDILLNRLPWSEVILRGPSSFPVGCITGYIAFVFFMIYVLITGYFPRKNENNYLTLVPLSLINGIASALIIFTINETFNRNMEYSKELLVYFLLSLLYFVYTFKLLQGRVIVLANELAYEKRIAITDRLLRSSFQVMEGIGRDRILTTLNNDCTAISQLPGLVVNLVSTVLTLIFCLLYLLTKNIWAFGASLGIILINGFISIWVGRKAAKYWEENRDIQDTYFGQLHDLINGFKELLLSQRRKLAFSSDLYKYTRLSADLNKKASIKFLNFNMYYVLMYYLALGVVVFIFPIFVLSLNVNQLRENLFIVFYMIAPFNTIAAAVPQLTQIRVNIKRINALIKELDENCMTADVSAEDIVINGASGPKEKRFQHQNEISIRFHEVLYKYFPPNQSGNQSENLSESLSENLSENKKDTESSEFILGPITTEFNTGEIVFITGGNGSGKSTLAKLITGLYIPQEGKITVNNHIYGRRELNELFSAVYSDFNLFKKLYGIDYQEKKGQVEEYLTLMKIRQKVAINDEGEFEHFHLSTGQKKRLAFIVSCLENKPMMLFDEWAAEQDPEFREFFYVDLLPMLKKAGKGVIVISHDDRYFGMADKLIKLERGVTIR